jgi:hypothetical protein
MPPEIAPGHSKTTDKASRKFSSAVFTLFPELPKELRDMIWRHAIPPPRIVAFNNTEVISAERQPFRVPVVSAEIKTPAILHICRDSRELGLQFYKQAFKFELRKPIYFDFDRDLVQFKNCPALRRYGMMNDMEGLGFSWPLRDLNTVREVVIRGWEENSHDTETALKSLLPFAYRCFKGLQTLYVIDERADEVPSDQTSDNWDKDRVEKAHASAVSFLKREDRIMRRRGKSPATSQPSGSKSTHLESSSQRRKSFQVL